MALFQKKLSQQVQEWAEAKLLPIGVTEFHEWADRIIDAAALPAERDDQKYVLASMVLHDLKPTDHKMSDGFFISKLRKIATNQVVHQMMVDLKAAKDAKLAEQAATDDKDAKPAEQAATNEAK